MPHPAPSLSEAQTKRLLTQILKGKELPEREVHAAYDAMVSLLIDASLWEGWESGQFTVKWDAVNQQFVWSNA